MRLRNNAATVLVALFYRLLASCCIDPCGAWIQSIDVAFPLTHHHPRGPSVVRLYSHQSSEEQRVVPLFVSELLLEAGISKERVLNCTAIVAQAGGFCNQLYQVAVVDDDSAAKTLIAKVFSPLAMRRISSVSDCFQLHQLVGKRNLGPGVIATLQRADRAAILMQECKGRTMRESDLHCSDHSQSPYTRHLLLTTAIALARLHELEPKQPFIDTKISNRPENVLFHACEVMLSFCNVDWNVKPFWGDLRRLKAAFQYHRLKALELLGDQDLVWTGHGDLKPSNVIIVHNDDDTDKGFQFVVRFIDFELAGLHYRAFDLAKLFRTNCPTAYSAKNLRFFLENYAVECNKRRSNDQLALNPDVLELQVKLMLPLTWLEAAIFFVCMAGQSKSSDEAERWHKLAVERLICHEECLDSREFEAYMMNISSASDESSAEHQNASFDA
jgi:thiamine kinase-like enzyme